MTAGPSHRLPARGSLVRTARAAGLESLPIAMGAASLLGWAFGTEQLKAGFPGDSPMKVNTAVLMLVTGLGLWLVRHHPERSRARTAGIALGAAALALALAILIEHATGRSFGIDELLVDDPSPATPGLPGVSTAVAFALGGAGVILLDVRLRRFRPAQVAALGMIIISVGPLTGYLYDAPALTHRGSIYGMALHSAMGVALLGAAMLAARPRAGMLALPSGEGAGSELARRLLIPAVLLPLALGYVQLKGEQHGWWDADTGVSLMVIAMILVFGSLVWHAAAGVQRADADLRAAHDQLGALNLVLEQRIEERTAELAASNRELEAFSYSVSHDLRAPLRGVDGFSKILLEEYSPRLDDDGRRYLRMVRESAQRMGELIDALLALARIGRKPLELQRVETADVAATAIAEIQRAQPDAAVEFHVGPLPPCQADPVLLRLVFQNLLENAVKYSRERSPAIVTVSSATAGAETVYSVDDNGCGFDPRYADGLFRVFSRLHRAEDYEGVGIGLATVQRIVTRHGGRIWADATPGAGATFSFTLEEPPGG